MDQVRIARFIDLQEAQIAAGLLQSHGLLVHVQSENLGAIDFLIRQAIGGFGLWVPEDEANEAKRILAEVRASDPEPDADPDETPSRAPVSLPLALASALIPELFLPLAVRVRERRWPASLSGSGILIAVAAVMAAIVGIVVLKQLSGGYHAY